ncbi:cytochrome b/b6 domain-containing protein [Rhizobium sp. 1399]|jgi:thiosulfate reductase cytochrome b subunit|uniref:cytochrome b/b6 domain-containing protein n=1 Tax=Rhizobium sp. 1399 TaxID=2817758 RepID=UPI00285A7ADC|nr:cytochrome b/b6 domain-containing protein [Rhizobium sp. 1399]MDR6669003.1 thiosulfate reductase cytochrome b subunit [Rhizobium sp. 1399]
MATLDDHSQATPTGPMTTVIRRHSLATRVTHWINVLCLSLLLMSGLQIFNAHPALYWGQYGADADPSWLSISAVDEDGGTRGVLRIGNLQITTTGILGVSGTGDDATERGFPSWITIPSYQDLATGRRWHLFFAWLFVINGSIYALIGFLSGHFRRDLAPSGEEISPHHLGQEIADHARLRFPRGEKAKHYNVLQKLAYLVVIFILLPLMFATGLTMSPGMDAGYPFLLDFFGGRQSARSIHFICAWSIVLFVFVHVAMVILSGLWNNMRSMITGRYVIETERDDR